MEERVIGREQGGERERAGVSVSICSAVTVGGKSLM